MRPRIRLQDKKAQLEAYGLAVIVILVIIGIFLVVSLRSHDQSPDIKKDYIYEQLPTDFVTSVVGITVDECRNERYTIGNLLRSCALGEGKSCMGMDACELANKTLTEIVKKSLVAQNYGFRMYTVNLDWEGHEIMIVNRGCTANSEKGKTGSAVITKYPQPEPLFLNLEICRN
jgi:hypothetical protein